MTPNKRLWLLAALTLILLGMLVRPQRPPAASLEPHSVPSPPSPPPPPPVAPPVSVPAKAAAEPDAGSSEAPQPATERGERLKEEGESLFGGAR